MVTLTTRDALPANSDFSYLSCARLAVIHKRSTQTEMQPATLCPP